MDRHELVRCGYFQGTPIYRCRACKGLVNLRNAIRHAVMNQYDVRPER